MALKLLQAFGYGRSHASDASTSLHNAADGSDAASLEEALIATADGRAPTSRPDGLSDRAWRALQEIARTRRDADEIHEDSKPDTQETSQVSGTRVALKTLYRVADHLDSTAANLLNLSIDSIEKANGALGNAGLNLSRAKEVVASVNDLSASLTGVSANVEQASKFSTEVAERMREAERTVSALEKASEKIADVVGLIRDVAEQTNLLALNATIEAARAGEAGRGFSVVAAEVKALARQTSEATASISEQINEIRTATELSVQAMRSGSEMVSGIRNQSEDIAQNVQRQASFAVKISDNTKLSADAASEISNRLDDVTTNVQETRVVAVQAREAAKELRQLAVYLRKNLD